MCPLETKSFDKEDSKAGGTAAVSNPKSAFRVEENRKQVGGACKVVPILFDEDNQEAPAFEVEHQTMTTGRPSIKDTVDETEEVTENCDSFHEEEDEGPAKPSYGHNVSFFIEFFKYMYSSVLLVFSVVVVMALIFSGQTQLAESSHPAVAFVAIWLLIGWLAMMEGGQGCLVGLGPIEKELYEETHPITIKSTVAAHKGDNMERFIIGRQFLVVLVVFVINLCGAAIPNATSVLNLPDALHEIFISTGVAMILMTIILGQLTAQVVATDCMLDFVNNYFMVFTTYASLAIEFSGLLHCVYLVQLFFSKVTGISIESEEPPRTQLQGIFFWMRTGFSVAVLGFAFAVTLKALFVGQTTMWDGIPSVVAVIIFFLLMGFVGIMEGMQIALFAVINLPDHELQEHKAAWAMCQLAFKGSNLQAFLIGRQILVTICMFIVARITSLKVEVGTGENVFGVSDGMQEFFNTGLLGAIITTVCASLAWRIIASSFPVAFLSNPLVYVILRVCLVLEASGLCSASWMLAAFQKRIGKYLPDECYIGTPEERAQAQRLKELEEGKDRCKVMMSTKPQPSMKNMMSYRSTSLRFSITDPNLHHLQEQNAEDGERRLSQVNMQSFRSPSLKFFT